MKQLFHSHILQAGDARFAYPLVQLTFPGVTLSEWLEFARAATRLPAKKGGLMAVRDARHHVHALFRYRVERDLPFPNILKVSNLIVVRLPGRALGTALIESFDELASISRCQAISLELVTSSRRGETGQELQLSEAGFLPYTISVLRRQAKLRQFGPSSLFAELGELSRENSIKPFIKKPPRRGSLPFEDAWQ
jgi:hypothetical protein